MSGPILVFDSGVGGLTVLAEIRELLPDATYVYAADTAVFPYGGLADEALLARVEKVMAALIERFAPRGRHRLQHGVDARLAEAAREIRGPLCRDGAHDQAGGRDDEIRNGQRARDARNGQARLHQRSHPAIPSGCAVTLVGSNRLAAIAEARLRGEAVSDQEIANEIAPCFVGREGRHTDVIVLACTHYPLLLDAFQRLAPWPVAWLDPAPAIARRVKEILPAGSETSAGFHLSVVTSDGEVTRRLAAAFERFELQPSSILLVDQLLELQ